MKLNSNKMKAMKTYDTPRTVNLGMVENEMIATSLDVDNTAGEWEGDAGRKGWNADDWSGADDWSDDEE